MSSLSSGQFHEQLPMFMTAHEIDKHEKGDRGLFAHSDESDATLHARKFDEAKQSGLASNLSKEGVKEPLTIWHDADGSKTLTDGHHRLAVMLQHNPHQFLPVQHEDLSNSPHLRPWS